MMNDWEDDERSHAPNRRWLCFNALMSDIGSPLMFPRGDLLQELPGFFNGTGSTPRGAAPATLREKLRALSVRQELLADERERLVRLEVRSVEDRLDEIRWTIELQGELMQISDRLYAARWKALQKYARENPTFLTGADEPVSLCVAAQVRTERNLQLRRAAERILALFDFLEFEQDREFGGGGSAPRG